MAVGHGVSADLQDRAWSAFRVGHRRAIPAMKGRHQLAFARKRQQREERTGVDDPRAIEAGALRRVEDRRILRIATSRPRRRPASLPAAGSPAAAASRTAAIGSRQRLTILSRRSERVFLPAAPDAHDAHAPGRQRAGLVGADDRRRSQRFDGGQAADDRIPARHPMDADRQRDRGDRRKRLRHGRDRQRDAPFRGRARAASPATRPARRPAPPPPSASHTSRLPSRSSRRSSGVGSATTPPTSAPIRPTSVSLPVAVMTARPRPVSTVVPLYTRLRRSASGVSSGSVMSGVLGHRHRFTRERRFVDRQTVGLKQPGISGDMLTSFELDDVAGDQIARVDVAPSSVADHEGARSRRAEAARPSRGGHEARSRSRSGCSGSAPRRSPRPRDHRRSRGKPRRPRPAGRR